MQKILISLGIIVVLALGGWYFFGDDISSWGANNGTTEQNGEVVATVNGEEITREQLESLKTQVAANQGADLATLDATAHAQLEQQALNALISQALLRQEVTASGIAAADADVATELANIQSQFESEAAFQEALTTQGFTQATFRTQLERELATQAYLAEELDFASLTASDEEVTTLYETSIEGSENAPVLEDVRAQVEQLVLQQKQQQLINAHVQELRADADVEVLISS